MNTTAEAKGAGLTQIDQENTLPHFTVDITTGIVTNGSAQIPPFKRGFLLDVLERFSHGNPTLQEISSLAETHKLMSDRQTVVMRLGALRTRLGQGPDFIKTAKTEDGTTIVVFNGTIELVGKDDKNQDQPSETLLNPGEIQIVKKEEPTLPTIEIDVKSGRISFEEKDLRPKKYLFEIIHEMAKNGRLSYEDAQRIAKENGLDISPVNLSMEIAKVSNKIAAPESKLIQLKEIEGRRFYLLNATPKITDGREQRIKNTKHRIQNPALPIEQRPVIISENAPTVFIDPERASIRIGDEAIKFHSPSFWRVFLKLAVNNGKTLTADDLDGLNTTSRTTSLTFVALRTFLRKRSSLIKNDAVNTREGGKWRLDANVEFLSAPPEDIAKEGIKQKEREIYQSREEQKEELRTKVLERAPEAIREKLAAAIQNFAVKELNAYLYISFTRATSQTREQWAVKVYPESDLPKALQNISTIVSRTRLDIETAGLEIAKERKMPHLFFYLRDPLLPDNSPLPTLSTTVTKTAQTKATSFTPRGERKIGTPPGRRTERTQTGRRARSLGQTETVQKRYEERVARQKKSLLKLTDFETRFLEYVTSNPGVTQEDLEEKFFSNKKSGVHGETPKGAVFALIDRVRGKIRGENQTIERIQDPKTGEIRYKKVAIVENNPVEPKSPEENTRSVTPDSPTHFHRWKIGEANGETSLGVCECGKTKLFRNTTDMITSTEYKLNI